MQLCPSGWQINYGQIDLNLTYRLILLRLTSLSLFSTLCSIFRQTLCYTQANSRLKKFCNDLFSQSIAFYLISQCYFSSGIQFCQDFDFGSSIPLHQFKKKYALICVQTLSKQCISFARQKNHTQKTGAACPE